MVRLNLHPQSRYKSRTCVSRSDRRVGRRAANSRTAGTVLEEAMGGSGEATRERILEIAEAAVLAKALRGDLDRRGHRQRPGSPRAASSIISGTRTRRRGKCCAGTWKPNDRLFDDHLQAGTRALRRSASVLPDLPEIARRDHGRPAQRPSRLPDRQHLLSGALVRPRGSRPRPRNQSGAGMRISVRSSTASPLSIPRASPSTSTISRR